jgi:hypothetical protein
MLALSAAGIRDLIALQREAIVAADRPSADELTTLGNAFKPS